MKISWRKSAFMALLCASFALADFFSGPAPARAQDQPVNIVLPSNLPESLRPWVTWVLRDREELACAQVPASADGTGGRQCVWPGRLLLEARRDGAAFTYYIRTDATEVVRLPGDATLWPQRVNVDGRAAVIIKDTDRPFTELAPGDHAITGSFEWRSPPQVVPASPETGIVVLTIHGAPVAHPRLDGDGRLWLEAPSDSEAPEAAIDTVRVSIQRMFHDGVPLRVQTRFELNIAGRSREIDLGRVLMPNSRPTEVRSALPVEIGADRGIRVFVRPGTHTFEIDAVLPENPTTLSPPEKNGDFFDPTEAWVWKQDNAVRSVELSGLTSVDPTRTTLPSEWYVGPTFLAAAGQSLTLHETRRGETHALPNDLHLVRELWLDLDGTGYTVRDAMTGQMHQGWRLNYGKNGALGRVSVVSSDAPLGRDVLITEDPRGKLRGIEVREGTLSVRADLRVQNARGTLDAVGWDENVQSLRATLNLPPGWKLLGGRGIDELRGTWFASWTLLDFFLLLLITISTGKLCGWQWAPVAAITLALSQDESDAPKWIWVILLTTLALLRVLPGGWVRKTIVVTRVATFVVLALLVAPFARSQLREALHPQVPSRPASGSFDDSSNFDFVSRDLAPPMAVSAPAPVELEEGGSGAQQERVRSGLAGLIGSAPQAPPDRAYSSYAMNKADLERVDPNAVVQTGPGVPSWTWRSHELVWKGPVRKGEKIDLYLLSPPMTGALMVLRVLLIIALALVLLQAPWMHWDPPASGSGTKTNLFGWLKRRSPGAPASTAGGPATAAIVAAALFLTGLSSHAFAQTELPPGNPGPFGPRPELLDQIVAEIEESQLCVGHCVVVSRADFRATATMLFMRAEVHAQQDSAWLLPGPDAAVSLVSAKVDGAPTLKLRREAGAGTFLRIPKGAHVIETESRIASETVVALQLDPNAKPQFVSFEATDWTIDGISPTGVPDTSIQLTRVATAEPGQEVATPDASRVVELPPWYSITRELVLGLTWKVNTSISRVSSSAGAIVRVPLLRGERVLSENVRVERATENAQAFGLVDIPRGQTSVMFESELPIDTEIHLVAPSGQPWTENWVLACGTTWHCEHEGLAPVRTMGPDQTLSPSWMPWPGETLKIMVNRPRGASGSASTIDSVRYELWPGSRLIRSEIEFAVRASQGGWERVTLPKNAELRAASIDGTSLYVQPRNGLIMVPLKPGSQRIKLEWQAPWHNEIAAKTPEIRLGNRAVNTQIIFHVAEKRWLLHASGPSWGPAVLYWSHLLMLLIVAVLLGRLPHLPLKTWEWFLLLIGMAQIPFPFSLVAVAWFILVSWRERTPDWFLFPVRQLAIIGWTVVFLGIVYASIHTNLLFDPDMQVRGYGSSNGELRWYADQVSTKLPMATIVSVPIWVWRAIMFAWSLWMVLRLLKWLRWGWKSFSTGGLWKMPTFKKKPDSPAPVAAATAAGLSPVEEPSVPVTSSHSAVAENGEAEPPKSS